VLPCLAVRAGNVSALRAALRTEQLGLVTFTRNQQKLWFMAGITIV
jgi:hypothetical protein